MNINEAIQSAINYQQEGNLQQAETIYKKIIKFQPTNLYVIHKLANILQDKGEIDEAIVWYQKAIKIKPNDFGSYYNLADAFMEKGQMDQAILNYQESIKINPTFPWAYNNLGLTLKDIGQVDDAIINFKKAIEFAPNFALAFNNLGNAFQYKGQLQEALIHFKRALQINPNLAEAYSNLGTVLAEMKKHDEAISCYQKALQINPNLADAYSNLGCAFLSKGQLDDAIDCYQKALLLNPNNDKMHIGLGSALQEKGQLDAVIACCKKALEINPDSAEAYSLLTYVMQQMCNWQEFEALTPKLDRLTRKALDTGTKSPETPFMSITRNADPSINLAIARSWSCDIARAMSNLKIHFTFDERKSFKRKIGVGYLSNDFCNHPVAHLMLSLFGLHNRDEFEIFCYSYGKDDGSYYRARIQHDCDKFVDISSLSYDAAARCIYEDQVDILVDLKGYTRRNRLAICALRPAPIQVSYLGFVGTTGADFIDYIITDKIVTPEDHSPYYSEKCVYMPHCYQVNDHTQVISNRDWKKMDFRLPEGSFVFCSFNQPYKIEQIIFNVWINILLQVPESVLWLSLENKTAEKKLRHESEARGLKSERLIFSNRLPIGEHLKRLKLADLALDTRIYNGGATTSNALWAGVGVQSKSV